MPRCLLLGYLLAASRAGATLPANNGGVAVYSAGDLAPLFTVLCANFSSAATGNYTLRLGGTVSDPLVPSSLIILSMQLGNGSAGGAVDLFVQHMAHDQHSLDGFLTSDAVGAGAAGNTSYLFLADAPTDAAAAAVTAALRARLVARLAAGVGAASGGLASGGLAVRLARLHFGIQSTNNTGALSDWLGQWSTPINVVQFNALDGRARAERRLVSRLDGKYESCAWPGENQQLAAIVDGGNGCQPLDDGKFAGQWVVVTSDGCAPEVAAAHGTAAKTAGAIVIASAGRLAEEMNSCGNGIATMVSHDDGMALLQEINLQGGSINGSFASTRSRGAFGAIDAAGRLQEVGWEKYATLEMLSWAGQYLDYTQSLAANISRPHFSVPLFDHAFGGSVTVTMPPAELLRLFNTMEIEHRLTCQDSPRMDESCPAWDHNIVLGVTCAATPTIAEQLTKAALTKARNISVGTLEPGGYHGELARYITPFRRRIGHWLTPATTLMPYVTGSNRSCTFHIQAPGGWESTFSLRFSTNALLGNPPSVTTPLFTGGGFGPAYNENRTLMVAPPKMQIPRTRPSKVELSYILSGHGECEFMPTTHVFTINGKKFKWSSEGVAGTSMGCSTHVRQGRVQPNEHGTWYTGRNGWCNGADVPVHIFDVTAAAIKSFPVNVTYQATGPGGKPPGGKGNIVLSSVLAWTMD